SATQQGGIRLADGAAKLERPAGAEHGASAVDRVPGQIKWLCEGSGREKKQADSHDSQSRFANAEHSSLSDLNSCTNEQPGLTATSRESLWSQHASDRSCPP